MQCCEWRMHVHQETEKIKSNFYSFITVKHNNPYRGKMYSQSIYTRLHVSAHIGPSSGQKKVQWFKNDLTMGPHLLKFNYYKIYKPYFHVMWTNIQWIDHTGSTHMSWNMFHILLHYVNILWWTDGVSLYVVILIWSDQASPYEYCGSIVSMEHIPW
jgi:hypothetical protein